MIGHTVDRAPTTRAGPFRDGYVHILSAKCSTCIFRSGNLMRLSPGRLKEMVVETLEADTAIVCHDTLDGDHALCRGFIDRYDNEVTALRLLASQPQFVREVSP